MFQGLTGHCSMPGMTAVAVAWGNQPSGVPEWCELDFWYSCSSLDLQPERGGDQEGGRRERTVVTSPLAGSDLSICLASLLPFFFW